MAAKLQYLVCWYQTAPGIDAALHVSPSGRLLWQFKLHLPSMLQCMCLLVWLGRIAAIPAVNLRMMELSHLRPAVLQRPCHRHQGVSRRCTHVVVRVFQACQQRGQSMGQ